MKELLERIDAEELVRQLAYALVEPWDERRADLRSAVVANVIANAHGAETKPSDFMPTYGPEAEKAIAERRTEVASKIGKWLGSMGIKR